MGGQRHAPAALLPGKTRYPLYRRLGGPQGRSGRVRKISSPPGFDPRTVQPVASRYTNWAIPAPIDKDLIKDRRCDNVLSGQASRTLRTLVEWSVKKLGRFVYHKSHAKVPGIENGAQWEDSSIWPHDPWHDVSNDRTANNTAMIHKTWILNIAVSASRLIDVA